MATTVSLNGTSFTIPSIGDSSWGDNVGSYLIALGSGVLQKAGGTFTLTADVNFGTGFGLKSPYFTSTASNPAGSGVVRLANTDAVSFRNSGNTADIALQPDVDGILQYGGVDLVNLSASQTLTNKNITGTFTGDLTGTASSATNATNATNVATTAASSNASYYPLFVSSSSNSNQAASLSTGLSFNPSTEALTATTFVGALTGAASGNVTLPSPTQHGVVISGSTLAASALTPNSSTAFPLISGGASANPSWAFLTVAGGGTGLTSGTSGGILGFTASGTIASSAALTANQLIVGGGAGATPSTLAAGAQYAPLVMGATAPSYAALNLGQSAAVTGTLPNANTTGASASLAASLVLRDANANAFMNHINEAFGTTVTAAGTTTLSAGSAPLQQFTGTTTQTVVLPAATSLATGWQFQIYNRSTGSVTIKDGGSNVILTMLGGTESILTCSAAGSSAGSWDISYTYSGVAALPVSLGGTGLSSATAYALLFGGTTSTGNFQQTTLGSSGQVLTSAGASALPTWTSALTNPMTSVGDLIVGGTSGAATRLAVGSTGNVLTVSGGTEAWSSIQGNSSILKSPTVQRFTGAPTGATNYPFTVSSANATVGATYTNNGQTFTVISTIASSTILFCSGTGTPSASGSLVKATGTGDSTITFSAYSGCYVLPSGPSPLYLRVRMIGGGSGGAGSGTSGTAGSSGAGGTTTFGSSLLSATGGGVATNGASFGGIGGTASITSPAYGLAVTGGQGAGTSNDVSAGTDLSGGMGASSPFSGGGSSGYGTSGLAPAANSGAGGGGGGTAGITNVITGAAGGAGGYIDAIIPSPGTVYSYTVGTGGAAGTLGTSGFAGGAGAAGSIIVEEYYQ